MTVRSFIFAGGGTGGHIFPALAIAEALRAIAPVRTTVVCSDRPLDADLLARAVAEHQTDAFVPIAARPFGARPRMLAALARSWGPSLRRVRALIQEERATGAEVAMVAMGGFVAAPAVQAAHAERCPVALVNLDAVPGLANRWIARRARPRFAVVAAPDTPRGVAWTVTPPIVRRSVLEPIDPREARRSLGLDPDAPTLLVTGGSQGARTINAFMILFSQAHAEALKDQRWQILHQSGADHAEAMTRHYHDLQIPARVEPTFAAMGPAWAAADAAVGRAGAGTVAESWATRTPTLFLPYPYHKDQHQRRNALPLAERGAALLGVDRIDPAANFRDNAPALFALLADSDHRQAIADALARLGPADGADAIARALLAG
jgi:UDP-N-acetylglucosamine--N-acetylmuramyl-(pentapeptide) pyrophosphoryl-undecaprenol N-acetylglucosamine transferase